MYFLFALALPFLSLAQAPKHKQEFTSEQRINLHAKKLQLALDLEDGQMASLKAVLKKHQSQRPERFEKLENSRDLNSEKRYQMQMNRMEARLAFQREMKTVLSKDQYVQWKKMMPKRHRDRTLMAYRKDKSRQEFRRKPLHKDH